MNTCGASNVHPPITVYAAHSRVERKPNKSIFMVSVTVKKAAIMHNIPVANLERWRKINA